MRIALSTPRKKHALERASCFVVSMRNFSRFSLSFTFAKVAKFKCLVVLRRRYGLGQRFSTYLTSPSRSNLVLHPPSVRSFSIATRETQYLLSQSPPLVHADYIKRMLPLLPPLVNKFRRTAPHLAFHVITSCCCGFQSPLSP